MKKFFESLMTRKEPIITNDRESLLKKQAELWDKLAVKDAELATDGISTYNPHHARDDEEYLKTLSTYFKPTPDKKLLDIGCGWGKALIPCAKVGMECWGVDISQVMLSKTKERAQKSGLKIKLSRANAAELPFMSNSFDLIWGYAILKHLTKSEVAKCLKEINRVLKSDGYTYLHFINQLHPMALISNFLSLLRKVLNKPISPIAIRRYYLSEIKKMTGIYFEQVEILVDDFMLFPLILPAKISSYSDLFSTGIPDINPDRYVNLLPTSLIGLINKFYDFLKRTANLHFPLLKWFCRDYIVIASRPRPIIG